MPAGRLARRSDPHDWNRFDNYLKTHQGYLAHWERIGFLLEDALEWRFEEDWSRITIRGRLHFRGGYSIAVDKVLEVRSIRGRCEVRTKYYAYQALRTTPDEEVRRLFRYDNDHQYTREGHPDEHHKHIVDEAGQEHVIWVGRQNWPTLHKVIDELFTLALQLDGTLWQ
ncbi:hypothetical protein HRbin28_02723 [bacterium HR28]|jgi:hypothetical protein|uniref:Uncharacterized protein n=1 Tax=Thermomicrobium roseum TaxID=500 RepID=A0A7C1X4L6_THERO|nr:hypothetical protein HRbin28_02723 [bacterium HR28]